VDHFRTTFTVPGELAAARLYITACGLYQATINGHRVGDFVMAPGFTSHQKRLHYQTYDVGALLTTGVNIVRSSSPTTESAARSAHHSR
jgi:alpha-L-rhamnosidase